MEVVQFMKKAMLVVMFVLAVGGLVMAQNATSPTDVLGAHNNGGRGCAGCHTPHSGAHGSGQTTKSGTDTGTFALWGQDASPLYGQTIAFGDGGAYTELLPSTITGGGAEVGGILLCLSCHDGNLTPTNMMTNQSYEQKIGLLTNTAYGNNPIPTLLGNDGTTAGNYQNDHPVGTNAAMVSYGYPMQGKTSGVTYTPAGGKGGTFTYSLGSQYATFVANYGYPAIAPGKWGAQFGETAAGIPFVTCTTCHNQHVMTVYAASTLSPIATNTTGFYTTLFFVNGPYNPNVGQPGKLQAPSTTQFCRQCHFGEANEANNTNNVVTIF
jgi:hypothetical protein